MAEQAAPPTPAPTANGRPADSQDNEKPTTPVTPPTPPAPPEGGLSLDEKRALLIIHASKARTDNDKLEKAMEQVRLVRKERNRNRNLCQTDGFSLKELDEILDDEQKAQHEVVAAAEVRTFMWTTLRQPVTGKNDTQQDMFDLAQTIRGDKSLDEDDAKWAGIGYAAGLRGDSGNPVDHDVPPDRVQPFTAGWQSGQAKLVDSKKMFTGIEKRRQKEAAK